ncbi:acetate--CoA ligase family protein, partial [Nocardiopsis tropica]|nr:acetate--CoA ligase family protein [Nocardiopsis tropica]
DAAVRQGLKPHDPDNLRPQATAEDFDLALETALAADDVHSVVVVFIPALHPISDDVARVLRARSLNSDKPIVATYLGRQGLPEELRHVGDRGETLRGSVPSYPSPEDAVRALAYATRYTQWRNRKPGRHPELPDIDGARARATLVRALRNAKPSADDVAWFGGERRYDEETAISGEDARDLLSCYGITAYPDIPVSSAEGAVVAAGHLGYPVVVKADSPDLRVRAGGAFVRADLRTPEDVRSAFLSLYD